MSPEPSRRDPDAPAQICPYCDKEIPGHVVKCRHCKSFLTEYPDLYLDLQGVEPDPELAGKVGEWPEGNLRMALSQYLHDYSLKQQKAILLELDRRARKSGDD